MRKNTIIESLENNEQIIDNAVHEHEEEKDNENPSPTHELVDVCMYNHASHRSGLTSTFVQNNRRRPAQQKERNKRTQDYPVGRVGANVQSDFHVLAIQEHGAVGPQGRRLLFSLGKRTALHNGHHYVNLAA